MSISVFEGEPLPLHGGRGEDLTGVTGKEASLQPGTALPEQTKEAELEEERHCIPEKWEVSTQVPKED